MKILYLGPDENMTNELIEWVQKQAMKYVATATQGFMSSKPIDGINHKKYGVTSEGLHVFLENAVNHLEIDPKKKISQLK